MRDSLKSTVGWLWALAFLALPDCSFTGRVDSSQFNLNPGPEPRTGAMFCDIEQILVFGRHCATDKEIENGIPVTRAAVALTRNEKSTIGLDYSAAATSALGCPAGRPVAIVFQCPFPDGCPVCVNCGEVLTPSGGDHANVAAVCAARCADLFDLQSLPDGSLVPAVPPDPLVAAFCADHSHPSTNANNSCFPGACTNAGSPVMPFTDPRRLPELVGWRDMVGVSQSLGTLTRTAPPTQNFDAGAASTQSIKAGDGYVEFTATETSLARACGLSAGAFPEPDNDPTLAGIDFAVRLTNTAEVFIHENGVQLTGGNPAGSFAFYGTGDRIRVGVTDNLDGTATIRYFLIPAACMGPLCEGTLLRTAGPAPYPFHADASLRNTGATLTSVGLVRIKQANE